MDNSSEEEALRRSPIYDKRPKSAISDSSEEELATGSVSGSSPVRIDRPDDVDDVSHASDSSSDTCAQSDAKDGQPNVTEIETTSNGVADAVDAVAIAITIEGGSEDATSNDTPKTPVKKKERSRTRRVEPGDPAAPQGLTTEEAKRRLLESLKAVIDEHRTALAAKLMPNAAAGFVKTVETLVFFLAVAALTAAFIALAVLEHVEERVIVEVGLLLLIFGINFFVHVRLHVWKQLYTVRRLEAHVAHFEQHGDPLLDTGVDRGTSSCTSYLTVCRNGSWQTLPHNLVVEGDLLGIVADQIVAINARCTEPGHEQLEIHQGERFKPPPALAGRCAAAADAHLTESTDDLWRLERGSRLLALADLYRFECLETPAVEQVRKTIEHQSDADRPHLNPQQRHINIVRQASMWVLIGFLVVSLIVNVLRYGIQERLASHNRWIWQLLVRQVYLALPLLHLSMPWLLLLIDSFGNAWLFADFQTTQLRQLEKQKSPAVGTSESFEVDTRSADLQPNKAAPPALIWRYFRTLVTLGEQSVWLSFQLVPMLANATVVSGVDKEVLLTNAMSYPEKIYLVKPPNELSDDDSDVVVLNLSQVPNGRQYSIKFDDQEWQQSHLTSLKPLGLNCLLNTSCKHQPAAEVSLSRSELSLQTILAREDPGDLSTQCCCLIGKEIGFSESAVETFVRMQEIHTFAPKFDRPNRKVPSQASPHMMSLVVSDTNSYTLHLQSRGNPHLVLAHCTDYFNGSAIIPLTEPVRQQILKMCAVAGDSNCVAFAYRPLNNRLKRMFINSHPGRFDSTDASADDSMFEDEETLLADFDELEPCIHLSDDPTAPHPDEVMIFDGSLTGSVAGSEAFRRRNRENTYKQMKKEQIFIGMIAMRQKPHFSAQKRIAALYEAGIRFVWFSAENIMRSTPFADKLGFATDWNCFISLKDPSPDDPEADASLNKAHLPQGIDETRRHLDEDVDDVPLLVPLFTDATRETTAEMIKIHQQYGNVVVVVGSGLDHSNTSIFAQANLALAMEPPRKLCLDQTSSIEHPVLSSSNLFSTGSSGSLSCDLTALPCPLVLHRYTRLSQVVALIEHARHMITNIKQSTLFALYCMGWLQGLLLLSYIMLPSPFQILNGIQLLYMIIFIVPVLSLSLLFTPAEADVMECLPAKNNASNLQRMHNVLASLLWRAAPCVVVSLVIFVWAMYDLWADSSSQSIFSFDTDSEEYNTDEFFEALRYAQNVLMFSLCYHMCWSSVSFLYHRSSVFTKAYMFNRLHFACLLLCLVLEVAFFAIYVSTIPHRLDQISYGLYILIFLWPIVIIAVDECVKYKERMWFQRFQKGIKFEFETRLGEYSPK
eukprot:TRINITY_DN7620_c0_g1_i2.p1 TRINITY_DN7620_c0_g1~~TRINITY_DN7620_c0_g1_i2.p1  ORF type:complete len:1341 (-),score=493.46 TRINITY_DN7620_c0_g1_i2:160-4182(-)